MAGACGIPSSATAVSVNLTVVNPTAQGELIAYPVDELRPTASAISYRAGVVRANNAILKLGGGALAFFANQPSGTVHLIIDVNGYFQEGSFSREYNPLDLYGELEDIFGPGYLVSDQFFSTWSRKSEVQNEAICRSDSRVSGWGFTRLAFCPRSL
jgi:hypothetical protein